MVGEFEADTDVLIEVGFPVFEVFPKYLDGSVISFQQPDDYFLCGAFSCTVWPKESEDLTFFNMERD